MSTSCVNTSTVQVVNTSTGQTGIKRKRKDSFIGDASLPDQSNVEQVHSSVAHAFQLAVRIRLKSREVQVPPVQPPVQAPVQPPVKPPVTQTNRSRRKSSSIVPIVPQNQVPLVVTLASEISPSEISTSIPINRKPMRAQPLPFSIIFPNVPVANDIPRIIIVIDPGCVLIHKWVKYIWNTDTKLYIPIDECSLSCNEYYNASGMVDRTRLAKVWYHDILVECKERLDTENAKRRAKLLPPIDTYIHLFENEEFVSTASNDNVEEVDDEDDKDVFQSIPISLDASVTLLNTISESVQTLSTKMQDVNSNSLDSSKMILSPSPATTTTTTSTIDSTSPSQSVSTIPSSVPLVSTKYASVDNFLTMKTVNRNRMYTYLNTLGLYYDILWKGMLHTKWSRAAFRVYTLRLKVLDTHFNKMKYGSKNPEDIPVLYGDGKFKSTGKYRKSVPTKTMFTHCVRHFPKTSYISEFNTTQIHSVCGCKMQPVCNDQNRIRQSLYHCLHCHELVERDKDAVTCMKRIFTSTNGFNVEGICKLLPCFDPTYKQTIRLTDPFVLFYTKVANGKNKKQGRNNNNNNNNNN